MYKSEKVSNHLESCKFSGKGDDTTLVAAFYVTPLTYDLCYEIDDRIAKQLFRREGKEHLPVQELGRTSLNLGELGRHNLEIFPHDQEGADGAGQMIASCKIGEVYVDKLFADQPEWSLIWKVSLPLDSHSTELCRKYFKKTCFITLVKTQESLIDEKADGKPKPVVIDDSTVECPVRMLCVTCNETATSLGDDASGWCDEHVHAAIGAHVRKIRYAEGVA